MAEEKSYTLSRAAGISLPISEVDRLLSAGDGTAALLYLYMLRMGGTLEPEAAARSLKRTEQEIRQAADKLRSLGLLQSDSRSPLPPPEELPEYSAQDVVVRTGSDPSFQAVLAETQRIFGRMLSGSELKTLFGIYDHLGMPAEVILVLLNHCVERCQARSGPGRLPTMRAVEKEAYVWANREIITLDRAEEHLRRQAENREALSRLRRILGLTDRELSPTERKYLESWLEMGFGPEALELAYDRTVTNTGRLTWKYMHSIVTSWHSKGLHTPEEIEKGDRPGRSGARTQENTQTQRPQADELERLRRMREKIRSEK